MSSEREPQDVAEEPTGPEDDAEEVERHEPEPDVELPRDDDVGE